MKNQEKKQKHPLTDNNTDKGNALVIILVAIVLLAGLTFTVMRSENKGDTNLLSKGEAKIITSQILKHAKSVENAIKKLQLVNGCSENQISFENAQVSGYTNANSPSDKSCHIFDVAGGGLSWLSTPSKINDGSDLIFSGRNRIPNIGTSGGDLAIIVPNITETACVEMNKFLGIGSSPLADPDFFSNNKFTGSYGVIAVVSWGGNMNFCVQTATTGGGTVGGNYYFIATLMAR